MACLHQIWEQSFSFDEFALPSSLWKNIGFQGTDPRTDLRGAGFVGLQHFQKFLALMPEGAAGDCEDDPSSALPMSIASINCTGMLLTYLQLAPKLTVAFLPGGRCECGHDTLHGFLGLAWREVGEAGGGDDGSSTDEHAERAATLLRCLQAMHARLLVHLIDLWKKMRAEDPRTTLLDFPRALRATHAHMVRTLAAGRPGAHAWRSLESVTDALGEYDLSDLKRVLGSHPTADARGDRGILTDCLTGPLATAAIEGVVKPAGSLLLGVASYAYGVIASVSCGLLSAENESEARPKRA
jgi:hypothetical protein